MPVSETPEYIAWRNLRNRCTNPNYRAYARYGGRGIGVCQRWESFHAFLEDMGARPSPKHSIDRKDNDQGYSKANCRWATVFEQRRNTSANTNVTAFGECKTLAEWALDDRCRCKRATLAWRLRQGMDPEMAMGVRFLPLAIGSFSPETIATMKAQRASGMCYRDIAKFHGCSRGSAHRLVNGLDGHSKPYDRTFPKRLSQRKDTP